MSETTLSLFEKNLLERQRRFQIYFSYIGITAFFIFGVVSITQGNSTFGLVEILLGIVGIINVTLIHGRKIALGISAGIILSAMIIAITGLVITGGIGGTGILWLFTYPPLALFLRGKARGTGWLILLIVVEMIIVVASTSGFIHIHYPVEFLRQAFAAFVAMTLLIYVYQNENEHGQEQYKESYRAAETALENSIREGNVRREAQKQIADTLNKIEEKNKNLEETQKAVLNVLDDLELEKQKVTIEKDKIDAIIQSIGDGVFVVDKNLRILLFNQVSATLSGYSLEEAIGKKYDEILKFENEETGEKTDKFIIETLKSGKAQSMSNHTLLVRKNGEKIPVADSAAPIFDKNKEVIGCVVVFRDTTLEREVDKAKTEFVSLASHQLRTPLSAINWYVEMLLDGDAGELNEEQKDFLQEVKDGNVRMVDLVNALLNVSRIDLGTFAIEPENTDVVEISKSIVKELAGQIKNKEQELVENYNPEKIEMMVDPKLIRIVFQNLISNAVKYTPEKGKIEVKVEKDDKELRVQVTDTGFGIPQEQHDKVFQKLFRADNVREKVTDGTGLGLYIVKSIVEQSGGTIRFESEENKGTTFFITLPATGMVEKKGNKELS